MKSIDVAEINAVMVPGSILMVFFIILVMSLAIGDTLLIILSFVMFAVGDGVAMLHLRRILNRIDDLKSDGCGRPNLDVSNTNEKYWCKKCDREHFYGSKIGQKHMKFEAYGIAVLGEE